MRPGDEPSDTVVRLGRRALLRTAALGAGGLAAAALIGCGGEDGPEPAASDAAGGAAAPAGPTLGKLVQDPSLPFPYNYPDSAKQPKAGGIMRVAATWDVGPMDPTTSAAGGTVTVPNMVYNRLIGLKRRPEAEPQRGRRSDRTCRARARCVAHQPSAAWALVGRGGRRSGDRPRAAA
jgi:hypothetical protein